MQKTNKIEKVDIETVEHFAGHVRVLKACRVAGLLVCQTLTVEMSYFAPSGRARLGTKRNYYLYVLDGEGATVGFSRASNKRDLNLEYKRTLQDILEKTDLDEAAK